MHKYFLCCLTWISFVIHLTSAQDPQVLISDPDVRPAVAFLRNPFFVTCEVTNKPPKLSVWWYKCGYVDKQTDEPKNCSTSIAQNTEPIDANLHYVDNPTEYEYRLMIRNVRESDQGYYLCKIVLSENTQIASWVKVIVVDPPTILSLTTISDTVVQAGQSKFLTCGAAGIPKPKLKWERVDGGNVEEAGDRVENDGGTLKIFGARPDARGQYKCTARNKYGSAVHFVNLIVKFEPIVKVRERKVFQKVGYKQELICEAWSSQPPLDQNGVTWTNPASEDVAGIVGYTVRFTKNADDKVTSRLVLENVVGNDFGTWTCTARGMENSASKQAELIESNEPQILISLNRVVQSGASISYSIVLLVSCLAVVFQR